MKPLSEIYKKLGIAFTFPIEIYDANGKATYYEYSDGHWQRWERNANGKVAYYEDSDDYWYRYEYDANGNPTYSEYSNDDYWERYERDSNGNETYFENRDGLKRGTPKSAKTCEGKVVEVDGIKYELKAL